MIAPEPTYATLKALHPDVQPASFTLTSEVCRIGRAPQCQIVVARTFVSRLHARIEREIVRYLLHDTGSANGTYVNQRRIQGPHLLKDRDQIGLGSPEPLLAFSDPDPTSVPAGLLRYDEQRLLFFLGEGPLELSVAQTRLLRHLYEHAGAICTRESCAIALWGQTYEPGRDAGALDRAINGLRAILRRANAGAELIKTHRGQGYELVL
ncbi:MAG: FHA domain-containing protein [Chloroflexales bacterium]|nr:FHA domain-containing protein [Chloroflexales bacterium]